MEIWSQSVSMSRDLKRILVLNRSPSEVGGDTIFTAWTQEPAWKRAHNVLLPAFAPQAIKGYTEKMADIADQLVMKWARLNPGDPVDVG